MRESTTTATRVVRTLTAGSKVCLLVAIPFLIAAAYFYLTPIMVQTATGTQACQSTFDPPSDAFVLAQCGDVHGIYAARSGASLLAGVLVAAVGVGLFGFSSRVDEQVDELSAAR